MVLSFRQAVKTLNKDWEIGKPTEIVDTNGQKWEKWKIIGQPTLADCLALATYLGIKYKNKYFYNKIY